MSKNKKLDDARYSVPTRLIYGQSHTDAWSWDDHLIPPLTRSSTFRLESAQRGAQGFNAVGDPKQKDNPPIFIYDRIAEPNKLLLADALATAEHAETAVTFASGMAAVHAAVGFSLTPECNEIISHKTIYGCTYSLFTEWFKRLSIPVKFCDLTDPTSFIPLVTERTKIIYLESPANPTLEILDIEVIAQLVKELNSRRPADRQILTVIDNTFCTPWSQRPITHGIDLVVHSLTKGISGFGTELGGAVVTRNEFNTPLILFRKDFGGAMSPSTAWHIHTYGISTLNLRLPKQQDNAIKIAKYLSNHPAVAEVFYPGLPSHPQYKIAQKLFKDYDGNFAPGFMIYFILKGDTPAQAQERGNRMMNYIAENAYTVTLAVSLGQLRTLIEHPGSMTHAAIPPEEQLKRGFHPGGIRLAVGIEDVRDLVRDLEEALSKI